MEPPSVTNMARKISILAPLLLLFLPPACCQLPGLNDFNYYSETVTWKDAQAFCRKNHTDLVTIRSEEEDQYLSYGISWIGLYRDDDNSPWKWSRGDEMANYTNWDTAGGEPHSREHCAIKLSNSKKWANAHCGSKFPFMCYEKLVLVKENKTWEDALNHCRSLGGVDPNDPASPYQNHRYDLATLITPDDHAYARERAQEATTDEVWTGLRFLAAHWWWVGGEPVQYEDIQSCPTLRSCGVLEKSGRASFQIRDCKERRNFFCYKTP